MTAEDAADEVDEAGGKSMVLCHQMLAMTQIEVGVHACLFCSDTNLVTSSM